MKPLNQPHEPDHAGVAFRPPLLLGLMLILGFLGRGLVQLPIMDTRLALAIGAIDILAAVGLFVWALRTMIGSGNTVPTDEPTDVIVTEGPYRFSRNPIYLAMVLLLLGLGLLTNTFWFWILALVFAVLLSWGVIAREESYLERKFGADYLAYKNRVRRWL